MLVSQFWFFIELQSILFRHDSEEMVVSSFAFLCTLAGTPQSHIVKYDIALFKMENKTIYIKHSMFVFK